MGEDGLSILCVISKEARLSPHAGEEGNILTLD